MKKILLTIEYNGKNFEGWQIQPKGRTVQGELEKALSKIFGHKIDIYGSGRTDSGVHALGQTAHFQLDDSSFEKFCENGILNKTKLLYAINGNLPEDVRILKLKKVKDNFHARFDVKEKIYLYKLKIGMPSPLQVGMIGNFKKPLDIAEMRKGAEYLVGQHDFTSFSSIKTETNDFVRTINYIKIRQIKSDEIHFEISGNGFLYNMVRIIVGTLIEVGEKKIAPNNIKEILLSKDRTKAGKTAQACGLYLKSVKY